MFFLISTLSFKGRTTWTLFMPTGKIGGKRAFVQSPTAAGFPLTEPFQNMRETSGKWTLKFLKGALTADLYYFLIAGGQVLLYYRKQLKLTGRIAYSYEKRR